MLNDSVRLRSVEYAESNHVSSSFFDHETFCLQSYSKLKRALRICASFRGTYLDTRDKADAVNKHNVESNAERM